MKIKKIFCLIILVLANFSSSSLIHAQENAELAKKLANPIASLISVPFQYNYDENYGLADDGSKHFVNIQPVIPFSLSEEFNLISRTILPVINQQDVPYGSDQSGIGDILQSFFVSPEEPTSSGLIWGLGPAIYLPTASEENLGAEKWAMGPTFVGLKQQGPWTYGLLTNHLWSFAGEDDCSNINATYLQPLFSYITKSLTTFAINTEATYDWRENNWTLPLNILVAQLFQIGDWPMQFGIGPRYWIESPDAGAEGWGARAMLTLLFPK